MNCTNKHGNITFGQLSNFLFTFIGTDFYEQNGIESKLRKDYMEEKRKYSNYYLFSKDCDIGKVQDKFCETLKKDYKVKNTLNHFVQLPTFLSLQYKNYFAGTIEKKHYLSCALYLYIVHLIQYKIIKSEKILDIFEESYTTIFKEYTVFDTKELTA